MKSPPRVLESIGTTQKSTNIFARHALTDEQLYRIYSIPGNQECIDCGQREPRPSWASVSHGTVVCITCSGTHRSMGVVKSFIKSLTMDSWTNEQLTNMFVGGNRKMSRYFLEAGISPRSRFSAGITINSRVLVDQPRQAETPKMLPIVEKYNTPAAERYRLRIVAERNRSPHKRRQHRARCKAKSLQMSAKVRAQNKDTKDNQTKPASIGAVCIVNAENINNFNQGRRKLTEGTSCLHSNTDIVEFEQDASVVHVSTYAGGAGNFSAQRRKSNKKGHEIDTNKRIPTSTISHYVDVPIKMKTPQNSALTQRGSEVLRQHVPNKTRRIESATWTGLQVDNDPATLTSTCRKILFLAVSACSSMVHCIKGGHIDDYQCSGENRLNVSDTNRQHNLKGMSWMKHNPWECLAREIAASGRATVN